MSGKVTKLEKEKRIFAVQTWIIDGQSDDTIIREIKSKWDLSIRQARRYLKQANENWKHDEDIAIESKRAAKIAELKELKRTLKEDFRGTPAGINAIVRIEKLIIRLENIEPPKQHEIKIEEKEIKGIKFND